MAQLVVRNLSDSVKERLRRQARANGRSMEEEARRILQEGVVGKRPRQQTEAATDGWATQIQKRFAAIGLTAKEYEAFEQSIEEVRKMPVREIDLG